LKKLLTPEQWAQHQRNKAKRLALAHTEVMAYDLELTSAQVPEVERINLASADRLVTALQALQVANPSRDQIREAARPILQERDGQLRRVLTASQWDELQQNRRTLQNLYAQQVASDSTTPKPKP
jgi:Spy/CpxP family protein refolding chaperone